MQTFWWSVASHMLKLWHFQIPWKMTPFALLISLAQTPQIIFGINSKSMRKGINWDLFIIFFIFISKFILIFSSNSTVFCACDPSWCFHSQPPFFRARLLRCLALYFHDLDLLQDSHLYGNMLNLFQYAFILEYVRDLQALTQWPLVLYLIWYWICK